MLEEDDSFGMQSTGVPHSPLIPRDVGAKTTPYTPEVSALVAVVTEPPT